MPKINSDGIRAAELPICGDDEMRLEHVLAARSLWYLDMHRVNPRGRNLQKAIPPLLMNWFGFVQPEDPKDGPVALKGGEFSPKEDGNDPTGVALTIYSDGLKAETTTSTEDTDAFIGVVLKRLVREGVVAVGAEAVKKKQYASELVIRLERELTLLSRLNAIADPVATAAYGPEGTRMQFFGIKFDIDPGLNNRQIPFVIERRLHEPLSENLYFSQAPLQTDKHLAILGLAETILGGDVATA